jgi:hypothetical protein
MAAVDGGWLGSLVMQIALELSSELAFPSQLIDNLLLMHGKKWQSNKLGGQIRSWTYGL